MQYCGSYVSFVGAKTLFSYVNNVTEILAFQMYLYPHIYFSKNQLFVIRLGESE